MIDDTLSTKEAQRFYDRIGKRYDWFEMYEGRAKARALELLNLTPGQCLLNVGVGTGKEHAHIQKAIGPQGNAFGLDISRVMVALARERTKSPIFQADTRYLPLANAKFDCLYAAYVLDLIPLSDIPSVLAEFRRVLMPGGLMVLLALTEGVNNLSRALIAIWKLIYAASPVASGGCRPLQLSSLVQDAEFTEVSREVIVQMAVPSEIIIARKQEAT